MKKSIEKILPHFLSIIASPGYFLKSNGPVKKHVSLRCDCGAQPSGGAIRGKRGATWDDLGAFLLLRTPANRPGADRISALAGGARSLAGKHASSHCGIG